MLAMMTSSRSRWSASVKDVALDLDLFGYGLDQEVGVRDSGHVGHGDKPAKHGILLRFRQLTLLDFAIKILRNGVHAPIEIALLHIAQNHLVAARANTCAIPLPKCQHPAPQRS